MTSFLALKKTKKDCSEVKNHEAGSDFLNFFIKQLQLLPISLHFSVFSTNFSLLDTDPHVECGSGSMRENDC